MMLSFRHQSYLGAVALNNSAVKLLERCAYPQAIKVLQDSIFVMKTVSDGYVDSNLNNKNEGINKDAKAATALEETLRNATRFLADKEPFCPANYQGDLTTATFSLEPQIFEIEDDDDYYFRPEQLNIPNYPFSTRGLFPIRIETSSHEEPSRGEPDLESAIILYNFAICQYMHATKATTAASSSSSSSTSTTTTTARAGELLVPTPKCGGSNSSGIGSNRHRIFRSTLNLAKLAYYIVSKRVGIIDDDENVDTAAHPRPSMFFNDKRASLLYLFLLLLHFLYQLYLSLGEEDTSEAGQVLEQFYRVRSQLLQEEAQGREDAFVGRSHVPPFSRASTAKAA